jgi:hypothetical protein
MMKKHGLSLILILLSLILGTLIYFVTRSDSVLLNHWLVQMDDGRFIRLFQNSISNANIPDWIIYSLPDALWMLAFMMTVLLIWDFQINSKSIQWVLLAGSAGVLYEIFQGINLIPGTFDFADLLFLIFGAVVPISIIFIKKHLCVTG